MHLDRVAVGLWSVNGTILRPRDTTKCYSNSSPHLQPTVRKYRHSTHHLYHLTLDAHDQITPSTMQKLDIAH